MDDFELALVVFGVVLLVLAVIAVLIGLAWLLGKLLHLAQRQANRSPQPQFIASLRPAFQQVAQIKDGKILPGPLYELPRMRLAHHGFPVIVEPQMVGGANSVFRVAVRMPWPDGALRLEVYPDDFFSQLRKLIGMRDIEIGDASFDRRYTITANNRAKARRLLTPEFRGLVELLRGPHAAGDIYIRIGGGELIVSRRQLTAQPLEVMELIDLSLRLYDAVMREPMAGIEFVDEPVVDQDAPLCQVCGERVDTPEVMCVKCSTPHHRECWHYFGGCSVYGCRGGEFEPFRPRRM